MGKAAGTITYRAIPLTVSIRFDGMGRIIRGYSKHALTKASSCRRYESCFEHARPPQELQLFSLSLSMVFCICLSTLSPTISFFGAQRSAIPCQHITRICAGIRTDRRSYVYFVSEYFVWRSVPFCALLPSMEETTISLPPYWKLPNSIGFVLISRPSFVT